MTAIIFIRNVSLCKTLSNFISQFTLLMTIDILHDHLRCIEKLDQYHPDILFIDPEDPIMGYKDFLLLINKPPFIVGLIQNQDKTKIMHYLDDGIFDLLLVQDLSLNYFCKKMNKIKFIVKRLEEKEDKTFANDYHEPIKYLSPKKRTESIFVKYERCSIRVRFEDVLYIKNTGTTLELYLVNNRILYHKSTLKKFILQLPDDFFIRINNSTVVNFKKIEVFEKNSVSIQNKNFPVTRIYLEPLKNKIIPKSSRL